jgi:threonine/homoserine/homoserine lactone efflux protein
LAWSNRSAGYLLFIAGRLWRDGGGQALQPAAAASRRAIVAQGVLTNVLNPKVLNPKVALFTC